MNAKFQRMIDIGKAYYGRIEQVLSEDRLQEINSASALMYPAPEGGEVCGLARSSGRKNRRPTSIAQHVSGGKGQSRSQILRAMLRPSPSSPSNGQS
jgi:hypothetical protein